VQLAELKGSEFQLGWAARSQRWVLPAKRIDYSPARRRLQCGTGPRGRQVPGRRGVETVSAPAQAASGVHGSRGAPPAGRQQAVSPAGQVAWALKTGGEVVSSPAISPHGRLYVGSGDGRLYAFW